MSRRAQFAALVLLATLCTAANLARSQESPPSLPSQPLTLDHAVEYGLAHNPTLKAAEQEVDAVAQKVKQSRAGFFPKLDTNYTFKEYKDQPYASLGGVIIPTSHTTLNHWEIDLVQPIFTGFQLSSQLQMSKMDLEIARDRLDETRLNVIREVKRTFIQILLGKELVKVAKDNVSSLKVQRRNAEANYEQGLTAQNDVLKADVALSQAEQQERAAEKDLTVLQSKLNQLLDLDLEKPLILNNEELRPPGPVDYDLQSLFDLAIKQRPENLAMITSIKQTREAMTAARSRYYPHVSAFGTYYREGEDFLADHNEYTNNENGVVGVRVDWNWFEGGKTPAQLKELLYRTKSLEDKSRDLRQQIRLQVEDAFEQLKVVRANIDTTRVALKQAEENERMTTLQYKEQLVIFLEVLNAQVFISQARADYYRAIYGYQLAMADLERAVGGPISNSK